MKAISIALIFVLLAGGAAAPRSTPRRRRAAANGIVKFQANTQLVVETVTVKDKNGKPIEGLTAKDFTVTEDGVPQTISFCEFQKLDEMAEPPLTGGGTGRGARAAPRRPAPARPRFRR